MDEFEWLPTECADERYPMQLISGLLLRGDDEIARVPADKIVNNGWGEIGSRRLVGEPRKPIPERIELEWFSYAEDQFFADTVELPLAELTELFRAGLREPTSGVSVSWAKIIVGMGLGGWTSVWLAGSGIVHEVLHTQLPPAQLDWTLVLDNPDIARADFVRSKLRSRLSDAALQSLAKHGPPVAKWPRRVQRYRWRLHVEGVQVPLNVFVRSFNGDRSFYDFARLPPDDLELAPKHLQITWMTRGGGRLLTDIQLDETEVFDIWDKACPADSDTAKARLRIELGARSRVTIAVESGGNRFPLNRASVDVKSLAKP